jgi:hypothetical protein
VGVPLLDSNVDPPPLESDTTIFEVCRCGLQELAAIQPDSSAGADKEPAHYGGHGDALLKESLRRAGTPPHYSEETD